MPPIPKVRKIVLQSTDAASGSTPARAIFNNIYLPDGWISKQAVVMCESFQALNNDSSASINQVFNLHLDGLIHPHSWYSYNRSLTDILATFTGYGFRQQCTTDATNAGILIDSSAFSNKTVTVIVESKLNTSFSFAVPWTLTLVVYERSDSDILG